MSIITPAASVLLSRGPGFARMAETMTGLIREIGRMFPVVLAE